MVENEVGAGGWDELARRLRADKSLIGGGRDCTPDPAAGGRECQQGFLGSRQKTAERASGGVQAADSRQAHSRPVR